MTYDILFFANAVLFGIGLAMDAFSVSMANGLNEPKMKKTKMAEIASTFAIFQIAMPLIGWLCVHTIATYFTAFQKAIPFIALALLGYIGGKMIVEGIRNKGESEEVSKLTFGALFIQGIATSIDALSVGFTIAEYDFTAALIESLIIGIVTFGICIGGVIIGKTVGNKISGKATLVGGIILVLIGLEIFIKGMIEMFA